MAEIKKIDTVTIEDPVATPSNPQPSQTTLLTITLNGVTTIESADLCGFKLISDIEEGLPHGYFEIQDKEGIYIGSLSDLSIGSRVSIEVFYNLTDEEMRQKKEPNYIKFPDFYILNFEDDCKDNLSKLAGTFRVYFGHPWLLFKDIKNHAYYPMNMGDLIKKVLQNEDRGVKFEVKDENFAKIDDNGKLARYKVAETDMDFIYNKLLPYCCSEQNPVHLFATDRGEFYLRSYKQLYKENSSVLFKPDAESMKDPALSKKETEILDKEGITETGGSVNISNIQLAVSNSDINKEWFTSFYLEDVVAGIGLTGGKLLTNQIKPHNGSSFGNYLPLDFRIPNMISGSSTKVIRNRPLDDSIFLLFASADKVDNIFQVQVNTPFIGCVAQCGDTASLIMPYVQHKEPRYPTEEKKENWLNGKYLITRIEHSLDNKGTDKTTLLTQATICRSNFVGSDKTTSLDGLAFLYESP